MRTSTDEDRNEFEDRILRDLRAAEQRCADHLANARAAYQTLAAHRSPWVREVGRKIKDRAEFIEGDTTGGEG